MIVGHPVLWHPGVVCHDQPTAGSRTGFAALPPRLEAYPAPAGTVLNKLFTVKVRLAGRPWQPGKWMGGKVGLFSTATPGVRIGGYADVDWFRVTQ